MKGELPVPQNWEDVDALGESMKVYNTSKIWAAVVDGDLGLQNEQQEFRNYYTNESKLLFRFLENCHSV